MLATVIITQNIIVSQAARQQKNNIVMCTDKDTGELITVYFDKNQTSSDLDLEDEPDAVAAPPPPSAPRCPRYRRIPSRPPTRSPPSQRLR